MNAFETMLSASGELAVEFLAHFDRERLLAAGFSPARVRDWRLAHSAYFGATTWTAKQREAVALARSSALTLDQLVLIEKRLRSVADDALRWQLRHRLLAFRGGYEALRRYADEVVPKPPPKKPRAQVRFCAAILGMRTMIVTAPERDITDIEHRLREDLDPELPEAPQMVAPLFDALRDGDAGIAHAVPRPLLLVPVEEHCRILAGSGDDVVLGLSDGTTMTGAEYLQEHFGDVLEVAAFHPAAGPVNMYHTERFANQKQRDLLRAAQPMCPVPDCRRAADFCEFHHITPWKHGGKTNLDNLAPLCRYHNRTNDDDPGTAKRGRIVRRNGRFSWRSPFDRDAVNARGPRGAMELLFG